MKSLFYRSVDYVCIFRWLLNFLDGLNILDLLYVVYFICIIYKKKLKKNVILCSGILYEVIF